MVKDFQNNNSSEIDKYFGYTTNVVVFYFANGFVVKIKRKNKRSQIDTPEYPNPYAIPLEYNEYIRLGLTPPPGLSKG